ncbi:MAG: RlpA-like double-psi beta-barrel domain-containing protein [bacterium]|nr:RlpA-like double-psi beta-barrel domain-containing protein [bacterium]
MNKYIKTVLVAILITAFAFPMATLKAEELLIAAPAPVSATVQLKAGVVQSASAGAIKISFPAKAIKQASAMKIDDLGSKFESPWNYSPLTSVYQFDFTDRGVAYDRAQPLRLEFKYEEKNDDYKQIFFYDGGQKRWRPLPSVDDPIKKIVSANIHFPFARIAVLTNSQVMTVGDASWYRFKSGLFAASPDFAKGTVVKVTNLDNGKSVNVTINDYGPDRKLHHSRVIDLDAVAFSKIASTKAGIIKVKIEPLKLVTAKDKEKIEPAGSVVTVSSKSAIVIRESDGSIIFGKNASTTAPLASLTKLVAAQVFLDTNPSLDREVAYSIKDEQYNHLYCKPWESARLRVADGETMKIQDLLYASLVGSANNAVESLVRVSGLSRNEFIAKMNEKAAAWGATSTRFVEPSGLSPENVSSPLDYAIMIKEIFKNPLLKKISSTVRYSFTTINKKIKHNLSNTNSGLLSAGYNITGSKTGYLDEAGYCLMTRVESPLGNLIIVNFGAQSKDDNFKDNERLINFGLKQLVK